MKKLLLLACVFCAASALGQSNLGSAMNAEVEMFQMPQHPRVAEQHDLALVRDLRERSSGNGYSKGERPLWEFMQLSPETPLGDSARAYRKEHLLAQKASIVWVN